MRDNISPDFTGVEQLYKQHASSVYLLYFIHTCLPGETRTLIKEQAGDWLTDSKSYANAKTGTPAVLRQAHSLSMQFYRRKLRKKIKTERLKTSQYPFPMTDPLIAVLHLPYQIKSPLVLCYGLGISVQDAAKILKCNESKIVKRLKQAESKLNMSPEEINAVLNDVRLSKSALNDIFDRIVVDAGEKGYKSKRRLNRWKRNLDRAVPFMALALLLLLLFAFLAVQFGWFGTAYGTYEYDYDTTPLISQTEDSEAPGSIVTGE